MTTEHLKILLDSVPGSSLGDVATLFARGRIPEDMLMVESWEDDCKADGGVRLVAHTIAKQLLSKLTVPPTLSNTLSQRGRGRSAWHTLQALTLTDENATLLSINGVGACDLISKRAM